MSQARGDTPSAGASAAGAGAGAGAAGAGAGGPSAPGSQAAAPAQARRRLRVLVIEDDPDLAEVLVATVKALGHDAEAVHDGRSGITAVVARAPDVVLLDIGLPDIDGYEAAREIRSRLPEGTRTRIVAVTGMSRPRDRRDELAGFSTRLLKPVGQEELRQVLEG